MLKPRQLLRSPVDEDGLSIGPRASASRLPTLFKSHETVSVAVSKTQQTSGTNLLNLRAENETSKSDRFRPESIEIERAKRSKEIYVTAERAFAEAQALRLEQREESNKAAVQKYKDAAELWRTVEEWRDVAKALRNAGEVYQILGDTEHADVSYSSALAVCRKAPDRLEEAKILNDIGYLRLVLGDTAATMKNCSNALRLSRAVNNRDLEAHALSNLGEGYYNSGDLHTAAEYHQKALQLLRTLNDHPGEAKVLVALGYDYMNLGEPEKTGSCYQEALSIARAAGDLRAESVALIALGNLKSKLGEKQEALNLYSQARDLVRRIGDRGLEATVLGGMGFVSLSFADKEKALEYETQALALFAFTHDTWGLAEATMDVGRIHHLLGDEQKALDHSQRALAMFTALSMPRLAAQALRDIGLTYQSLGDTARAISSYEKALQQTRAGQDQRDEAYTLNYIGRVYDDLGKEQRALEYYQQALSLNHIAADPAGESLTLYNIAHAEGALGHFDEARRKLNAALAIVESLRVKVASQDSRAAYFASTRQYYELWADVLMQLQKTRPAEGFAAAAFEASEKARARSLLETLKETRADIREGVDVSLLERERSLQQSLNAKAERHAQLVGDKASANEAGALAREIDQLATDYDEVKAQIKSKSPRYAALTQPQPLGLPEIQREVLDDDSLLLEYMLGDERSYLWAVTRTEISTFELPGRPQIEDAALRFHKLLTANQPVPGETFEQRQDRVREANAHIVEEAASFSKLVLGPVTTRLGRKRLIIVPDGALQYIPFQALVVPGTAKGNEATAQSSTSVGNEELIPLMVDHEIVNEPSASALALVLKETAQRKQAPNTIVVLANPVFEADDPRIKSKSSTETKTARLPQDTPVREVFRDSGFGEGLRIPPLPASREEANAIMAVVPWRTGFKAEGFEASRATITRPDLNQYRIVHFATHGFVDYKHPELSGLVLSLFDEQGNPQNGFLRLHDIYNLKLSADLVVLSACNTGLGKDVKGEGLIGLTRGFMYAGAGGVVASLWKVDDDATAELMTHFYEGMFKRGLTPAAALRDAQLAMWRQKRWHSPYFWAAFVIQGQYNQQLNSGSRLTPAERVAALGVLVSGLSMGVFFLLRRRRRRIL